MVDGITLLRNDHRSVERLFKRFEKLGDDVSDEKREVVDAIVTQLSVHAAIEERVFYPAVRESVEESEDQVLEALEEHHVLKWTLSELEGLDPGAERFDAKVTVLMESVRHHVEEEEGELFPTVRAALGRARLQEIGAALEKAKATAPTSPEPQAPDAPPGNVTDAGTAEALEQARSNGKGKKKSGAKGTTKGKAKKKPKK